MTSHTGVEFQLDEQSGQAVLQASVQAAIRKATKRGRGAGCCKARRPAGRLAGLSLTTTGAGREGAGGRGRGATLATPWPCARTKGSGANKFKVFALAGHGGARHGGQLVSTVTAAFQCTA